MSHNVGFDPQASVKEYLDKHEISNRTEEVMNMLAKAKPDEPLSFLV